VDGIDPATPARQSSLYRLRGWFPVLSDNFGRSD
jgi:hypothetical protein